MIQMRWLSLCLMSLALPAVELTVALTGDDLAAGSAQRPLATLAMAQQRARAAIAAGDQQVVVQIKAGRWILPEPLVFTAADVPATGEARWVGESGTVLSGGTALRHWQAAGPGRWRVELAPGAPVSSLWTGIQPVPSTRWPEHGWARLTAVGAQWSIAPKPPRGTGIATVLHAWGAGRCAVTIAEGHVVPSGNLGWAPVPELAPVVGRPLMIEGLSEPTAAGGWRHDAPTSLVLGSALSPTDDLYVVPRLSTVLAIAGTATAPVRRLSLRNLTIAHAAWPVPPTGVIGVQAGHVIEEGQIAAAPAAVQLAWAEDVGLDHLQIAACAGGGLAVGQGCARVRITRCVIEDVGATGIMVGWRGRALTALGADWALASEIPREVVVERCRISRAAQRDPGAVGIAVLFAREARLTANLIEDLPYSGISLGFRWDTTATSQRGAQVESNHIRRVMRLLTDGGGIYTLGWQPGAQLRGNLIEEVGNVSPVEGAPSGGLFFDNGSKGIAVEGNVIAQITGEALRFNGCAPSWLLLGDNVVLSDEQRQVPPGVAEGVGP